jgi:hypothetical protein
MHHTSGRNLNVIVRFSVAQAFTPGVRKRRRYQSPINGAFETNRSFIPRRKRLGYGKVISNWGPTAIPLVDSATENDGNNSPISLI